MLAILPASARTLPFVRSAGGRRTFQTLTASRVLPYTSASLYDIIADIDAYSRFVPYCTSSRVTALSAPHPVTKKRYPVAGELTAGFKGIEESFVSRIYCVPGQVVEAVGGAARTTVKETKWMDEGRTGRESLAALGHAAEASQLMKHLLTRWSIEPLDSDTIEGESSQREKGHAKTRVDLRIEYEMANPIYMAISQAFEGKIAAVMIEAFEKRAAHLLE